MSSTLDLWNWRPEGTEPAPQPPALPVAPAPPQAPPPAPVKFAAPPGRPFIATVSNGPTTTILYLPNGRLEEGLIVVVDDTVHWTASWYPQARRELEGRGWLRGKRIAAGFSSTTWPKASHHVQAMLDWARRAGLGPGKDRAEIGARDLRAVGMLLAPCPRIGEVRYAGWKAVEKQSAHTFEALHGAVVRAVEACAAAWSWDPTGLSISFFTGRRAMGLAYHPGRGDRRIALHHDLLARYDLDSVARTVLHELCHHAREELHPRGDIHAYGRAAAATLAHDQKFCEMLAMVDPAVASSPASCRYFDDDADPEALKGLAARRGVVHAAAAGALRLAVASRRGAVKFRWEPTGTARWKAVWEPLNASSWRAFLSSFPENERALILTSFVGTRTATAPAPLPAFIRAMRVAGHTQLAAALETTP